MPTFERCPKEVENLALEVLFKHESHRPLIDAKVSVDYLFAMADEDEDGNPINNAITVHGMPALAVARKNSLKHRAAGLSDAEITIDYAWWKEASTLEREALLDHEIYHLELKSNEDGICKDDLGRPLLKIRKHDYQFGWFNIVAERNGIHSVERKQARLIVEIAGQFYFPELLSEQHPVTA